MHPFSLEGKRILITGASSGIGRATAIACAQMGAACVITGRDNDRLDATKNSLGNGAHCAIPADLLNAEQRVALADAAGVLDGVVHCAGAISPVPMRMESEKHLRAMLALNYESPTLLTQRMLAKKSLRDGASVLFISSLAAQSAANGVGAYAGSKAAIIATARCMAFELAKQRIRVNCICPSVIESELVDAQGHQHLLETVRAAHPLGLGSPSDVAHAAVYFLSDASRWVTGCVHVMDGGYTLN